MSKIEKTSIGTWNIQILTEKEEPVEEVMKYTQVFDDEDRCAWS